MATEYPLIVKMSTAIGNFGPGILNDIDVKYLNIIEDILLKPSIPSNSLEILIDLCEYLGIYELEEKLKKEYAKTIFPTLNIEEIKNLMECGEINQAFREKYATILSEFSVI